MPITILVHSKLVDFNNIVTVNYNGYETKMKIDLNRRQ